MPVFLLPIKTCSCICFIFTLFFLFQNSCFMFFLWVPGPALELREQGCW